jgi:hypothetical protein
MTPELVAESVVRLVPRRGSVKCAKRVLNAGCCHNPSRRQRCRLGRADTSSVFAGVVDGLEDVRRHGFFVERPTERGWLMAADDLPIAVKKEGIEGKR